MIIVFRFPLLLFSPYLHCLRMTTTQYDLIQRLLELSRSNQIDWQRIGDYSFAYEIDDTRFLFEKFVSRLDDALITCFRLQLLHPFDRLLMNGWEGPMVGRLIHLFYWVICIMQSLFNPMHLIVYFYNVHFRWKWLCIDDRGYFFSS